MSGVNRTTAAGKRNAGITGGSGKCTSCGAVGSPGVIPRITIVNGHRTVGAVGLDIGANGRISNWNTDGENSQSHIGGRGANQYLLDFLFFGEKAFHVVPTHQ